MLFRELTNWCIQLKHGCYYICTYTALFLSATWHRLVGENPLCKWLKNTTPSRTPWNSLTHKIHFETRPDLLLNLHAPFVMVPGFSSFLSPTLTHFSFCSSTRGNYSLWVAIPSMKQLNSTNQVSVLLLFLQRSNMLNTTSHVLSFVESGTNINAFWGDNFFSLWSPQRLDSHPVPHRMYV